MWSNCLLFLDVAKWVLDKQITSKDKKITYNYKLVDDFHDKKHSRNPVETNPRNRYRPLTPESPSINSVPKKITENESDEKLRKELDEELDDLDDYALHEMVSSLIG